MTGQIEAASVAWGGDGRRHSGGRAATAIGGSASIGHKLSKTLRNWEHDEADRDLDHEHDDARFEILPEDEKADGPTARGPGAKSRA